MPRYCTYEHSDNHFEPACMTEAVFATPAGRAIVDDADAYVWQEAPDEATALAQHNDLHDKWAADQEAGRPEAYTYTATS